MFGLRFKRPVGAAVDIKEVEYIIALHQTSSETRSNGTVSSQDIKALLKSRYSLDISHDQAIEVIKSLGGGGYDREEPEEEDEGANGTTAAKAMDGMWHKIMHGFKNPFEKHEETPEEDPNATATAATLSGEEEDLPLHGTATPSATGASSKRSASAANLSVLHRLQNATHRGGADDNMVRVMQEKVKADLKAKMMQANQNQQDAGMRNLNYTQSMDSATEEVAAAGSSGTAPVEAAAGHATVDDGNDILKALSFAEDPAVIEEAAVDHEIVLNEQEEMVEFDEPDTGGSIQWFSSVVPNGVNNESQSSLKQSANYVEQAPEFLDLVQILTTIMIPSLARMAHEANEDRIHENDPPMFGPQDNPEKGTNRFTRIFTDCIHHLVAYCRRKLQINDDVELSLSSRELLVLGRKALMKDIGEIESPVVDEAFIQYLLVSHGEIERANDTKLVREMAELAQSASGTFDEEALINAISSDLELWDPANEDTPSTFFQDVFQLPLPKRGIKLQAEPLDEDGKTNQGPPVLNADDEEKKETEEEEAQDEEDKDIENMPGNSEENNKKRGFFAWKKRRRDRAKKQREERKEKRKEKKKVGAGFNTRNSTLDLVVDNHSSVVVVVMIWVFYIFSVGVYGSVVLQVTTAEEFWDDCGLEDFWCTLFETIYSWAFFAIVLSLFGLIFIIPLSVGNGPRRRTFPGQFFAFLVTVLYAVGPYIALEVVEYYTGPLEVLSGEEETLYKRFQEITLGIGFLLALLFGLQAFLVLVGMCFKRLADPSFTRNLFYPIRMLIGFDYWYDESRIHCAARRKVNKIITNAATLHLLGDEATNAAKGREAKKALRGTTDRTSRNFILYGERIEWAGGIFWTWWRIFDGSLFSDEGLWISTRLVVIQVAQGFVAFLFNLILIVATETGAQALDDYRQELEDEGETSETLFEIIPTGKMIRSAFFPAAFCSIVISVFLCSLYVPSAFATILKYRSNVMPSLGSPYFEIYRNTVDSTYMNTGNAVYGLVGSAGLFFVAIGLILFLFYWPISQSFAFQLMAWGLGLGITIGIKMMMTMACRTIQYRKFYRIHPHAANVTSLALECWFLGIAGSVLLARVGQFLFAALFWVGRIDVPFLAEDVQLFGYAFDYVPHHFLKDLLVHEAHRHPYIERLSQMYLMKLRHGDDFVSNAGSAWRQLLVTAMLPWLNKHRVFSDERREEARLEAEEEQEREEDEKRFYRGGDVTKKVVGIGKVAVAEVADGGKEIAGAGTGIVTDVGKVATSPARNMARSSVAAEGSMPPIPPSSNLSTVEEC